MAEPVFSEKIYGLVNEIMLMGFLTVSQLNELYDLAHVAAEDEEKVYARLQAFAARVHEIDNDVMVQKLALFDNYLTQVKGLSHDADRLDRGYRETVAEHAEEATQANLLGQLDQK